MAQIIKHRRGSLESLSAVTSSLVKGEIVIASGSSNLSVTNGASIVFAVPENGQVQAVNRILVGANAPNTFAAGTYNGMLKGVPYYASGSSTLYLLGEGANEIPDLTGNISNFSSSVATSINALSSSIGGGSIGNSVTLLNTFSGSQLTQNSTLATYTGSVETRLTEIGVVSGSLIASASTAKSTNDSQGVSITNLNSFSSSQLTQNSTLATYTGSVSTRLTEIGVVSGSLISSASNAAVRLTDIEAFSGAFNTAFDLSGANVTIAGNLTVAGTTTQVNSTTIQLGDNIIELNGTGAANGGLLVKDPTAPNTVSGSLLWDSTNDYWKAGAAGAESKVALMGGDNLVTSSQQILFDQINGYSTFSGSVATSFSASNASITSLSASVASVTGDFSSSVATSFSQSNASIVALSASVASVTGDFSSSVATSFSASAASQLSLSSSFASSQATQNGRLDNLETTSGSLNSFSSSINTTIKTKLDAETVVSGSSQIDITSTTGFTTFSSSIETRISLIDGGTY